MEKKLIQNESQIYSIQQYIDTLQAERNTLDTKCRQIKLSKGNLITNNKADQKLVDYYIKCDPDVAEFVQKRNLD